MKRSVWVMKFNSETRKHDYSLKEKDTQEIIVHSLVMLKLENS